MKRWERELVRLLEQKIEEWSAAFPGTPEDQMVALELLADMRDMAVRESKR
jgi:hypothetical protein